MTKKKDPNVWKVPKREFQYFCSRVKHWCKMFGLDAFVLYRHQKTGKLDNSGSCVDMALVEWGFDRRLVTVSHISFRHHILSQP